MLFEGGIGIIETIITGAILALISAVISLVISHFSSRAIVKKELEKMKLAWQREDSVTYENEFSEMVNAVSRYIVSCYSSDKQEALGKVGCLRSKRSGSVAFFLDELYQEISENQNDCIKDTLAILVDEERKSKFGDPAEDKREKHQAKVK